MKALVVAGLAAMLLLGASAAVIAVRGAPPGRDTGNEIVNSWLAAMAEPSGDRGWSGLSVEAQTMIYQGDANAYWNDLDQVDWARVAWAPANGYVDDGAYYSGSAWLRSHPSTLPRFLLERGLATPHCVDGMPYGINLQMRLGWFNPARVSALLGKAGGADPCGLAFEERPGTVHEPFDLVGGAWASPGEIQRIGVHERSGLVRSIVWGRAGPDLDRDVEVTNFGPHELAVTWRGAACDSNTIIVVDGDAEDLRMTVVRGLDGGCSGTEVVYESILQLGRAIEADDVEVELASGEAPAGDRSTP